MVEQVTAQLADDLTVALAGPVRDLLGTDLAQLLEARIRQRAGLLAAQLASDDDHLAAQTTQDVLGALWPHGVSDPAWWRTAAGRLCARSLGLQDADAVTHSAAAAMLGVTRGTVAQLVHRGSLERHPDGGVTRASVLLRLSR